MNRFDMSRLAKIQNLSGRPTFVNDSFCPAQDLIWLNALVLTFYVPQLAHNSSFDSTRLEGPQLELIGRLFDRFLPPGGARR